MKIYSINLDKDINNWEKIDRMNMKYNLNILRLPGIDGIELMETNCYNDIKNLVTKQYMDKTDPRKIGKMLSHGRMWKKIVREDLNNIMVIHDNVEFLGTKDQFNGLLDKIMNDLPVNYDIIFVGNDGICKDGENQFKVNVCESYNYLYNIPVWSDDISAYIISNNGARKLLSYMFPLMDDLDIQIGKLMKENKIVAYSSKYPLTRNNNRYTQKKDVHILDIYINKVKQNKKHLGLLVIGLIILFVLFGRKTKYGKIIMDKINNLKNKYK